MQKISSGFFHLGITESLRLIVSYDLKITTNFALHRFKLSYGIYYIKIKWTLMGKSCRIKTLIFHGEHLQLTAIINFLVVNSLVIVAPNDIVIILSF